MVSSAPTTDPSFLTASTTFEDSIAKICWGPSERTPLLAVSSWDSKIRLYNINNGSSIEEKLTIQTEYPCLAVCWPDESSSIATGSIDGTISVFDIYTGGLSMNLGKHDDAVQGIYSIPNGPLLCSVSYDKTLKVWDSRQPGTAVKSVNLAAKVVCSDMAFPYMAVGLSNQKFHFFSVLRIGRALETFDIGPEINTTLGTDSPLSSVSVTRAQTIVFGSTSGKCVVSSLRETYDSDSDSDSDSQFCLCAPHCFLPHKLGPGESGNTSNFTIRYPINAVGRNRDTYFTAGSDGFIHFWDPRETLLSSFSTGGIPVTEAKWSPDARFVAYGIGYDWAKGIEGAKSYKTELRIHTVQFNAVAPRGLFSNR